MGLFSRFEEPTIDAYTKWADGVIYCIFVPSSVVASSIYSSERDKAVVVAMMNTGLDAAETEALANTPLGFGLPMDITWTSNLTDTEVRTYLSVLERRYELCRVYRIKRDELSLKANQLDAQVWSLINRRFKRAEARKAWGF